MTATTEILAIAKSSGANVDSQATYAARTSLIDDGFASNAVVIGTAFNKALRQSTFMAAGLANALVNRGISVPDDGDVATLAANIYAGMTSQAITKITVFDTPGSSTAYVPAKSKIYVMALGGGGGGGGGLDANYSGGGGGGGAGIFFREFTVTPGASLTITVGEGGAGGTGGASPTNGADGTDSVIAGLPGPATFTIPGGSGGTAANVVGYTPGGGQVGTADTQIGGSGGYGIGAVPGTGGGSMMSPTSNPVAAAPLVYNARGSGGAGGYINQNGQDGGNGYVMIFE